MCERPLIGSTSACACVQTGRGGGAVARTSLPAPLHHRSERLERLVSATVLPPSTLCSTIRYTVCVHYKPITENSNCTLLLRYCTVCTRYSYPWVRGALSTESRISVKRRSIQDFPGLGPLCSRSSTVYTIILVVPANCAGGEYLGEPSAGRTVVLINSMDRILALHALLGAVPVPGHILEEQGIPGP